jgi:CBS domain-containing protein
MDIKEITKDAVVINENITFGEAIEAMDKNKTNTLLVTDDEGLLTGEVTMTDILEAIIPDNLDGDQVMEQLYTDEGLRKAVKGAFEKPVIDFMSVDFTSLSLDDNMINVIATAIANNRSSIPVVDIDNRPVGIVSRRGLKQIIRKLASS